MKNKTILVVDDSAVIRLLNSAVLKEGGLPRVAGRRREHRTGHARKAEIHLVLSTVSSDTSKAEARKAGASGWLFKLIEPRNTSGGG